jgi:hypothetical protein
MAFWEVTGFSLLDRYSGFGGTRCPHIQVNTCISYVRRNDPTVCWYLKYQKHQTLSNSTAAEAHGWVNMTPFLNIHFTWTYPLQGTTMSDKEVWLGGWEGVLGDAYAVVS